jgi:hypothetical protein
MRCARVFPSGDAQNLGDSATARHVRLDHIHVPAFEQLLKSTQRGVFFTGGDADVHRIGQFRIRVELVRQKRLLEPENAQLLELPRHPYCRLGIGAVAKAGVNQDIHPVARRLASGPGQPHIVIRILTERTPT